MAVELITSIKKFRGESADTKPTSGIPAGSLFYEKDTLDVYEYSDTGWNKQVLKFSRIEEEE